MRGASLSHESLNCSQKGPTNDSQSGSKNIRDQNKMFQMVSKKDELAFFIRAANNPKK